MSRERNHDACWFFMEEKRKEAKSLWDQLDNKARQKYEDMAIISSIQELVQETFNAKTLLDTPFYALNFIGVCVKTSLLTWPREVGLARYTLRSGVTKHYHQFIRHPVIPTEYFLEAKDAIYNFHGISREVEGDTTDYGEVYKNIVDMVAESKLEDGTILVYCKREDIEANTNYLNFLYENSQTQDPLNIYFADLADLVVVLRRVVKDPVVARSNVDNYLVLPTYDLYKEVRCGYHEDLDNRNCALRFSKGCWYLTSDWVIESFRVDKTENHIPLFAQQDANEKEQWVTVGEKKKCSKINNIVASQSPNFGVTQSNKRKTTPEPYDILVSNPFELLEDGVEH